MTEVLSFRLRGERAVRRDLTAAERARARMGEEGERRMGIYLPRDEPARDRTWEADHKQLDVLVRPTGGHRPVRPWLTSFLDTYSRAVMGYAVSLVPDRGVVLAALGASMRLDEARGPFVARPGQVRCDHGLEFAAGAIREAAAAIGFVGRHGDGTPRDSQMKRKRQTNETRLLQHLDD